jgi:probable rRNA maturation factor
MKKALPTTLADWTPIAERRLRAVLRKAQAETGLRRRLKGGASWTAEVRLVGSAAMTRLNGQYRGKHYATDVLSFPTPAVFQAAGNLGELVICLPTLKRQARERGHAPDLELDVLLVHGVLHLLGLDHELGPRQAAEMARWEGKLLPKRVRGLIETVNGVKI